jgi:hypothetical protein
MSLLYQTVSFDDNLSLPHFLPKPLKSDSLYEGFIRSSKKKEVDIEFKGMLLSQTEQYLNLLKRLENRFWLYDKEIPIQNRSFIFRYKAFDSVSNQLILADGNKMKASLNSLIYSYNARKYLLQQKKENFIIKSRPLSLTKAGLELSFYGKRALVANSKIFKKGNISYKLWLILNLNFLGQLNFFKLQKWEINSRMDFPKNERNSFVKKMNYYYNQNNLLNSYILLSKKEVKIKSCEKKY